MRPLAVVRARSRSIRRVALAALLAAAILSIGPSAGGPWHLGGPFIARAASPTPSADAGDTRSAGEGPGIVGSPFIAIAGVLGIALAAAAVTLLYVRLSGPGQGLPARPRRSGETRPGQERPGQERPGEERRHGPPPPPDRG